jgi:alcohol dehydrogenase class IV
MNSFVNTGLPARVGFGAGSLQYREREINALGARKALVLSTPEQRESAEMIADLLGARSAGVFARAVMQVPIMETAREARELALKLCADCAVAIGGGSTGLGKSIALGAMRAMATAVQGQSAAQAVSTWPGTTVRRWQCETSVSFVNHGTVRAEVSKGQGDRVLLRHHF